MSMQLGSLHAHPSEKANLPHLTKVIFNLAGVVEMDARFVSKQQGKRNMSLQLRSNHHPLSMGDVLCHAGAVEYLLVRPCNEPRCLRMQGIVATLRHCLDVYLKAARPAPCSAVQILVEIVEQYLKRGVIVCFVKLRSGNEVSGVIALPSCVLERR
jgi:hypothetical protein